MRTKHERCQGKDRDHIWDIDSDYFWQVRARWRTFKCIICGKKGPWGAVYYAEDGKELGVLATNYGHGGKKFRAKMIKYKPNPYVNSYEA